MFNTVSFIDVEDFCSMLDDVFSDTKESVSVIAKYHDAKEIIKELVLYGYDLDILIWIMNIQMNMKLWLLVIVFIVIN